MFAEYESLVFVIDALRRGLSEKLILEVGVGFCDYFCRAWAYEHFDVFCCLFFACCFIWVCVLGKNIGACTDKEDDNDQGNRFVHCYIVAYCCR